MEPKNPLFSIICATYNRAELLRRAIKSVLRQTIGEFELIIVNDGSTDDTTNIIKAFDDKRIIYISHSINKGLNAARNSGFAAAKGKFLAFLDDDDELVESALQMALSAYHSLNSKRIRLLFFNCLNVENKIISETWLNSPRIIKYEDLLCKKIQGDYWIVVERSVLPAVKLFDEQTWGAAGVLWLKLLQSFDAYYLPKVAYLTYREHENLRLTNFDSTTRNWIMHERYTEQVLNEFGEDMNRICPKIYSKQICVLAFYKLMNGNFKGARSDLVLSMKTKLSAFGLGLFFVSIFSNQKLALIMYSRLNRFLSRSYYR
jgi:GalNAc5-diNAcBac-PP-undecaprenol beta-1,3-glucosyltransferase